ncbi:polyamine-modulated factor 1-binding protein 1 [Copidosoma floridanum]|uniref:polyamine-modulated factor 1-binding protein 1 n=1 Tax=Copidosoma floridanum TaxID=29053 RepID=UPI0006C9C010|nr:polyamine-modulated factor 1-binding protein 1 [Copidosoma floridanum]
MEKHQYVRAFISAASEYAKHPSEASGSVIQRNLGALSASLDLSIFDPGTSISAAFYVSLHELMNSLGSRSSLIWSTIDVLQTACKNPAARQALIHTYKFASILTRLLEANLTSEKRIRVLKLFQELTYGIKISWQEAHLPYLMTTLSQWITQSSDEEVISLSLGVLVNLCYKNLPAVYALMRSVNTKTFLQSVVKTRGQNINIRVQCCKLLIILEYANSDILDSYILDVALVTFTNIIPTLKKEDVLLLRHIVDFFDDIRQNERFRAVLLTYSNYVKDVTDILATLKDVSNRECAGLVMEFLHSLMKLQAPCLVQLYPLIVKTAVSWVTTESVSSKALALIRTIVCDSRRSKSSAEVLEALDLSVLTLLIKEDDDIDGIDRSQSSTIEVEKNLTELMQLFQELVKTPSIRTQVLEVFSISKMRILMKEVLECSNDSSIIEKPRNLFQDSSTNFYVHALSLIADLAINNTHWLEMYTELLRKKQIQMILATALYTSDCEVKQKVLQLTSTVGFPKECLSAVANCMTELEPLVLVQEKTSVTKISETFTNSQTHDVMPLFSLAQEGRLDTFISKLEAAFEENKLPEITTSAVMELYEYKMAAMRHAERAMQSSLEAATNHATSLQHRLAQLVAQSSQLHQVLFNTQQCLEGMQTEKIGLMRRLHEMEEKSKKTHVAQSQEIAGLKKIVIEKENHVTAYAAHIKELEVKNEEIPLLLNKIKELKTEVHQSATELKELGAKNQEMSKLLHKMQESVNKKDQIIEEKNKEIKSKEKDIVALNLEMKQQTQQCHNYQKALAEKEETVQKLSNELHSLSRMREMIFELTAKKENL